MFKIRDLILALAAAIAFVLCFIAAGIVALSAVFLLIGMACVALLAFGLIRRVRGARKPAPPAAT